MKTYYLAAVSGSNEKYYAYVLPVRSNANLVHVIRSTDTLIIAQICGTKKEAESLVSIWNKDYRNNGAYMFSDAPRF